MSVGFDSAWLARFEARRSVPTEKPTPDAVVVEADLHTEISAECRRRGWLAYHGSMAHATHRTGGEPDFVILADGGRLLQVECKSATGKLSIDQQAICAWAAKLGHKVHVVRSFREFLTLANNLCLSTEHADTSTPFHPQQPATATTA